MSWLNIENTIEKKEVLSFYKEYSKGDLDIEYLEPVYKHIIRKKQQKDIYEQHPALGHLSSTIIISALLL